ncbi:hypothetical protein [Stigmatella aurantiaca]|uniref:Conserved uncharacterized protein n=1 Tax=Stigmatella aurantiaca (strain DW4/3-1) TaxID=378806 RepID=Q09AA6_STIAD|nr:hypothetical protein [Stigmatella aurantiaca]ADO75045.1 conserved uncharacterized protein [Stigmatella aurantiaca DW4/3-1]EAU68649.1 hypothetical protein STIAU_6021 [Stigmatella aurantiaca DW4/3-1]
MRKLMMAAVLVMGMSLGYTAEAKDPQKMDQTQPQSQQGPTDAEIDEAHRMNKEYDERKAAGQSQAKQGPTDAEIDEAHRMNKEYDERKAARANAKTQEVMGNIQSVSGTDLTIRMPTKLNRKMDFKTDAQSKVMKDSQTAALTDLKEGDEVRVSYQIVGRERIVVSVDAHKAGTATPAPAKKP